MNNHDNEDLDLDLDVSASKSYHLKEVTMPGKRYNLTLSMEITDEVSEYYELLHFLQHGAQEGDLIDLNLVNLGGSCYTGVFLAHALKNCRAYVNTNVWFTAASMGAIIALSGDTLNMAPGSTLMFHNYSTMDAGKGHELLTSMVEFKKSWEETFKYFCCPFLTEKDIKNILQDRDMHIHANAAASRIERHFGVQELIIETEETQENSND